MKKCFTVILICIGFRSYAQVRIVVATSSAETFLETYEQRSAYYSNQFTLAKAYRLGPASIRTLKESIKTALKWIDLNVTHQKDFEKEICRLMAMEKEQYKFHGYVDQIANETTLQFTGLSDGSFVLEIKQYGLGRHERTDVDVPS